MGLLSTPTSQCLDKKLKILGFEIPDLIIMTMTLTVLNFVFGPFNQRLLLVFLPTVAVSAAIFTGKRGKPDGHLFHLLRFRLQPKYLSAFLESGDMVSPYKRSVGSKK